MLVIVAGFGLLTLVHVNAQVIAERLVSRLHLNAANEIPRIFLEYSASLSDKKLAFLAAMALLYAIARLIEAYGLWFGRAWAEWFAVVTAAIYIPFELIELARGNVSVAIMALSVNLIIVAVMVQALRGRHAEHEQRRR